MELLAHRSFFVTLTISHLEHADAREREKIAVLNRKLHGLIAAMTGSSGAGAGSGVTAGSIEDNSNIRKQSDRIQKRRENIQTKTEKKKKKKNAAAKNTATANPYNANPFTGGKKSALLYPLVYHAEQ